MQGKEGLCAPAYLVGVGLGGGKRELPPSLTALGSSGPPCANIAVVDMIHFAFTLNERRGHISSGQRRDVILDSQRTTSVVIWEINCLEVGSSQKQGKYSLGPMRTQDGCQGLKQHGGSKTG